MPISHAASLGREDASEPRSNHRPHRQLPIHTHSHNAVVLVWGLLRLGPTNSCTDGFRIGFNWSRAHQSVNHNMPSAALRAEVIEDNIRRETEEQRPFRPFRVGDFNPAVHISKFGVIEKNKVRHPKCIQTSYPTDRYLLGTSWKGKIYVDGTLPLGSGLHQNYSRQ